MPKANKFRAAFHANLQGFIFNAKFQHAQYGFFWNAKAHSFSVAVSAKLHGMFLNANLATWNLVGQTRSRISKLRRLGYSVKFRVRHIGVKCRGLHVRCKSVLRRWPTSAKPRASDSATLGRQQDLDRASFERSGSSSSSFSSASALSAIPHGLFHNPEKLAQNLEEVFRNPEKLLQMVAGVFHTLRRKLPFSWLKDVGKLYLSEGQLPGLVAYLASRQKGAMLIQALCLVSTLVILIQLAIAATIPKLALSISVSAISLGVCLDYMSLLAAGIWKLWAESQGVTLPPQIKRMFFAPDSTHRNPRETAIA